MIPALVPESWTAWETIVVNTVSSSRVELTAWPTSPRAFISSTDRTSSRVRACSSWNRRTFSIAITAWSAKVLSRAICFAEKGRGPRRWIVIAPIATPLTEKRHAENYLNAFAFDGRLDVRELASRYSRHVGHVNCLAFDHRAAAHGGARDGPGLADAQRRLDRPVGRDLPHEGALGVVECRIVRLAQSRRALDDRVYHRLNIGRRTGDHAQDFAGRSLLLKALLQLVE